MFEAAPGAFGARSNLANAAILRVNESIQDYLQKGMANRQKRLEEQTKRNEYDHDEVINWLQTIRRKSMPQEGEDAQPAKLRVALDASEKLGKHIGMWPKNLEVNAIRIFTPAEREMAMIYKLPVDEYIERQKAGTLPPIPVVPETLVFK